MTLTKWSMTTMLGRRLAVTLLMAALVTFAMAPSLLELDPSGTELWFVVGWIVTAFLAGLLSFRAAAMVKDPDRLAWRSLGLGCYAWMVAIMACGGYGWIEAVL
jgi:hypothetical protein